MGICDDTLWALKRLASSISGSSKGKPERGELGEQAPLRIKDDVLLTEESPEATLGGAKDGGGGEREGRKIAPCPIRQKGPSPPCDVDGKISSWNAN